MKKIYLIFIMAALIVGMGLVNAAYFISWQNWNDDFEGGIINTTLWTNISLLGGSYGGGGSSATITENTGSDGYIYMYLYLTNSAGWDRWGVNYFKTNQDFNDGKNYNINFMMNYSSVVANEYKQIIISNGTPETTWQTNGRLLYNFISTTTKADNYTITIRGNNFTLYNSTNLLNSTIADNTKQWRIEFSNAYYISISANGASYLELYNFTTLATDYILNHLISPLNNTNNANYNTYFSANLTTSSSNYKISNATLYVWNSSNSIVNQTLISFSGTSQSEIANMSVLLNYTSYTWNYLARATNGTSVLSQWGDYNYTLNISDTTPPNIIINTPTNPTADLNFYVNISGINDYGGLSYCKFWIMRGASYEIGNTTINFVNFTEPVSVSGLATYGLHVWCNDTKNNINETIFMFNVGSTPYVPPTYNPPSGGGGTITNIITVLSNYTASNYCEPKRLPLTLAWNNFIMKKDFTNFKIVWFAFFDYATCKNTADLIPI